jgi:uncharacterized protein
VIAVDTNLLVYSHRQEMPQHSLAAACIQSLAEDRQPWAIPWPCVHEFISTVSNQRVFKTPTPMATVFKVIETWLGSPTLVLLHEQNDYWVQLRRLLNTPGVAGPMVHDARIAALCMHHGVRELWTADRDFKRFAGLRTRNPLVDV